MSLAELQ